jgi:hypothetical protein
MIGLFLALSSVATGERVEHVLIDYDAGVPVAIHIPTEGKADGRVVLLLHGGDWQGHPADYDANAHAASLAARGCVVFAADLRPISPRARAASSKVFEQNWRGIVDNHAARLAGENYRVIPVPAGFDLADPIPFYQAGPQLQTLDLVYPLAGAPAPTLIRIDSRLFGMETTFYLATQGFALAIVRDPRNDLKLPPEQIGQYGAAAARAIRANADRLRLNGRVGIFGLSKHGFAAGLIGAYNPRLLTPPVNALHGEHSGAIDAVGMFTDSYDPPTRDADFKVAGHRVDQNPGDHHDDAASPVRVLTRGAPAYLLTDAHRRPSRQVLRMIEALQRCEVPFEQTWYPDQPNYARKSKETIRDFFRRHLAPDAKD